MRARPFGPTGRTLPVVGQGTWMMERDPAASMAALRRGLELGLTVVDTAEMYGSGAVEALVGEAIAGRRDEVFLVSKVLPSNASRAGTRAAAERSLARLDTEHLDLYLLHWPGSHPLEDTVATLEELVDEGTLGAWGVSNFDVDELDALAGIAGADRIACNQVLYHLGERAIEHAVLPWCREHGVAVQAYSPLGQGDFPARGAPGRTLLDEIGTAHGAGPHAVALAFLLREPDVFVLPKASRLAHVDENAAAGTLELEPDEIARLDAAFPRGARPSRLPVL